MDDFAGDFAYLNNIRDAQMFQRAPQGKFERLCPFEYYDNAEFEDRFRFTKEEIQSYMFTLTPVRWSQCWTEKSYQKRYDFKYSNIIMRV